MTTIHGGDPFGADSVQKAEVLAAYAAATSGLTKADWRDLVGVTDEQASHGGSVRGISLLGDYGRLRRPIDTATSTRLSLLSFARDPSGAEVSHVVNGVVEAGRFAFRDADFSVPPEGTPLGRANAKLSTREPAREDRLFAAGLVDRGRGTLSVADPEAKPVRVFATLAELGGAVDFAMIQAKPGAPGRVPTDHAVTAGIRRLVAAVEQPVYDAAMKRTPYIRNGRDGVADLFHGFGPGSARGLWIDPAKAARIEGGTELLSSLAEATQGRDPRSARREASMTKARDAEGPGR